MTSVQHAADLPHAFAKAFNSFDPAEVERVYEPESLLILDVARRGPDGSWRYIIDNPQPVGR
jgi:hypothetical protein